MPVLLSRVFCSQLLHITFFFFCFICVKCFAISEGQNRSCQEYCVMWLQERVALGVNIPPDVEQTVKTCFWTEDANFLDCLQLRAVLCHPTWNMTWLKEKRGREMFGKTWHSSREQTDYISPRLHMQCQTGKGSGKGVSNLFPVLRQSIAPALPVTGHWPEWMCWVFLLSTETTAMLHHS